MSVISEVLNEISSLTVNELMSRTLELRERIQEYSETKQTPTSVPPLEIQELQAQLHLLTPIADFCEYVAIDDLDTRDWGPLIEIGNTQHFLGLMGPGGGYEMTIGQCLCWAARNAAPKLWIES